MKKIKINIIVAVMFVIIGIEAYAGTFVATSTFAGTDNSVNSSDLGVSFSNTNEKVWAAHIIVNGVEYANATVMVGYQKGGLFSGAKDTARIIGAPSGSIWARVRINNITLTPYAYGNNTQNTNTTSNHVSNPSFLCAFGRYTIVEDEE